MQKFGPWKIGGCKDRTYIYVGKVGVSSSGLIFRSFDLLAVGAADQGSPVVESLPPQLDHVSAI